MRKYRVGKRIIMPLFFAAIWLGAGDSFARDQIEVSVKLHKKPTIRMSREKYKVTSDAPNELWTENTWETKPYILDIDVSNKGKEEVTCQVKWYFIGEVILREHGSVRGRTGKLVVADDGYTEITLGSGETVRAVGKTVFKSRSSFLEAKAYLDIVASPWTTPDPRYPDLGWYNWSYDRAAGRAYAGYIVLIEVDGEVISKESNSYQFLKDKWIRKCE